MQQINQSMNQLIPQHSVILRSARTYHNSWSPGSKPFSSTQGQAGHGFKARRSRRSPAFYSFICGCSAVSVSSFITALPLIPVLSFSLSLRVVPLGKGNKNTDYVLVLSLMQEELGSNSCVAQKWRAFLGDPPPKKVIDFWATRLHPVNILLFLSLWRSVSRRSFLVPLTRALLPQFLVL